MTCILHEAAPADKAILRHLLELCSHDYSEFNGEDVDEHGLFGYPYLDHYWTEEGRYPFLIRVEGRIAGFALARALLDEGEATYSLAEFFILRKYRRRGIGQEAAAQLFDRLPGKWLVAQEAANEPAQRFWRRVIDRYTGGMFQPVSRPGWDGPIWEFDSV